MFQRIGDLDHGGTFQAAYLIDADAGRSTIVLDTVSSFLVLGATISPAGDQVAWRRWNPEPEGCYSVYTTDLTGANPRRLSNFLPWCNSEGDPSWTPLGDGVVFVGGVGVGEAIYERVLETDSLVRMVDIAAYRPGPISVAVHGGLAFANGVQIIGAPTAGDPVGELYHTASVTTFVYFAAWSADGSELAFLEVMRDTAQGGGPVLSTSLKLLAPGSGLVRTVVTVAGSGGPEWAGVENPVSVCWLPGGTRLVFTAPDATLVPDDALRANLYVVAVDGSGLVRLTTAPDAFDYNVSCTW